MALPTIFCPQCGTLILEAKQCPACQWQRPAAGGDVGKPTWAVALEAKLPSKESRPSAAGSWVYFSTDSGQIVALDTLESKPENIIKWRYQVDSRYKCHGLAIWEEALLLGNEFAGGFPTPPGELLLLQLKSGEETWRYKVEGASLSIPTVHNNTAFFTVNSGVLYAVDLEARKELWQQEIEVSWSWAPAAPLLTPTGLLVLSSRSENLVAIDIETREVAWTFSGGGWFAHTPIWVDGTVYVRCWDQHIYAIDGTNGQEIWRYKPARDYSSDIWVSKDYLYVGVKDYQEGAEEGSPAYALYTLDRQTGQRVSRYQVPGHVFARPVATTEAVFFATDDKSREIKSQGTLYALEVEGQELLWEPCVVEQRFQSDLLLVDNWIIAGTRQGAVYAIPWIVEEAITDTPQTYAAQGEWKKAAIAHALQGEYTQAAQIYASRLEDPLHAGQLFLHAGEHFQVVELLGQSKNETERALAHKAVQALSEPDQRAEALREMGEYLAAAQIYSQAGVLEHAGDCYLEAQAWQEAQDAYAQAGAWKKWEKVAREQELWQDLIDRYVSVGEYAQAAEIQIERGHYLEAATYFDKAGMQAEALDAYRRVSPENITQEAEDRMLELAQETGEVEIVLEAYQASGQFAQAAELAKTNGLYSRALEMYQQIDNHLKAAEMLDKLNRYAEAATMYEKARRFGQAAQNLEQQVEQEIERVGGIRYITNTEQLEAWLDRARDLYEEEADYAVDETARTRFFDSADRCRIRLMRIKREPLLKLSLNADRLVYNQGNALRYVVENVGWGTARNVTLSISGNNLLDEERYDLGTLGRRQKTEGIATVVPTLVGEIMLQIELQGLSKSGELHESLTQTLSVAPMPASGGAGVSLNTQVGRGAERLRSTELPTLDRGTLWDVGTASSTGASEAAPVSAEELNQQRVESLRRQLAKYYSNLNIREEQAANYPVGQAPLEIINDINNLQQKIDEIEDLLEELEA